MTKTPKLVDSGPEREAAGLIHRVLEPEGDGPHPTAVMLHGYKGDEEVMWIFASTLPDDWLVVAPRAIHKNPSGGYVWHRHMPGQWPNLDDFDEAVTAVTQFIHALPDLYDADLDQIYLMGFSQGAATAYATAIHHPGLVQAIAGLVGFMPVACDEALEASPLADIPMFMAVGKQDEIIPYDKATLCAQTLYVAGSNLEYHEYDTGHRLNTEGMRDLKAWWAEQADK